MTNEVLTADSRVADVLAHPLGYDMLYRLSLQTGIDFGRIERWPVRRLKLKHLERMAGKKLDAGFLRAFLELLNTETARPAPEDGRIRPVWWKEAVIYQIYPPSFQDSDGDGWGDLAGITARLPYLKTLGINCIWLSPIFRSPFDDNGYDVSDYRDIDPRYGDLDAFDRLLETAHGLGIRVLLDLVFNHTSDEHPWFQAALADSGSPYRDYYFLHPDSDGPPNNWTSFFSGSAWRHFPDQGVWGLHLFSSRQMDLNWDNPEVRKELCDIACFWLERGVDGFRLDVINYVSKRPGLPDGHVAIGELVGFTGIEHYVFGPYLHEYLHELNEKAFAEHGALSIGETPGVGREMGKLLTDPDRGELDLVMSFDHLEMPGRTRFDKYRYDLNAYKAYRLRQSAETGGRYWQTLFFDNHDNPRMVGKVNPDPAVREVLAKLLNGLLLTGCGTPLIYQGQELGMSEIAFRSASEFRDVESLNLYDELLREKGQPPSEAFAHVLAGSRDHARVPLVWDDSLFGGFSRTEPWLWPSERPAVMPALRQAETADSVFAFTRSLIRLRNMHDTFVYGSEAWEQPHVTNYYGMHRHGREKFFIEANLHELILRRPHHPDGRHLLGNYGQPGEVLRPYEINIYIK